MTIKELTITDLKRSLVTNKRSRDFNFGEVFFACDLAEIYALGNNNFRKGSQFFSMHPFSTLPVFTGEDYAWTSSTEDAIINLRLELEVALIKQKELQELVHFYQRPKRSAKQKEADAIEMRKYLALPEDTILKG